MIKLDDLILKNVTKIVSFIILSFSIYIFFAGHNTPGGGFVGGLLSSASLVLMSLAYDLETMKKVLPIDFKKVTASGLLLAVGYGAGGMLFGQPFLTHTFGYYDLPFFGENTELATATIFDLGVYLTVVGVTMTIILTIAGDDD